MSPPVPDNSREDLDVALAASEARRRAAETVAALGRTLVESLDPADVAQRIADGLRRLLGVLTVGVFRLDADSGDLVSLAFSGDLGEGPDQGPDQPVVFPAGTSVIGVAVRERRPITTPDLFADSRVILTPDVQARIAKAGYGAGLAVPLIVRGRVIGALGTGDRTGRVFTDDEVGLAAAFADHAAIALRNAHLHQKLRDAHDSLQAIAANSADGLVTTDVRGRITYWSPGAEDIFGYGAAEVMGRSIADYYQDGLDEARAVMRRIRAEGRIRDYEATIRARDGRRVPTSQSISALRDEHGTIVGTLGVFRDMTERQAAAAEIERQRETRTQSEKLATLGSLLAGIAHELNNPLTVLLAHAELFRAVAQDPTVIKRIDSMHAAAERCVRIVRNFLALARHRPPERRPVDLNEVVHEVVELLAYLLRVDGVQVALDLTEDLPRLSADSHQLHQVLVNLVTNAAYAMREVTTRRLTLSTRRSPDGTRVLVVVTDTGPGIPPEVQARMFEPFFTTKPVGEGTGLGLPLSRSFVEAHAGAIRVTSEVGHGASFEITLPVTRESAEDRREPAPSTMPPRRLTILLVDDDAPVAVAVGDMLALDGHVVEIKTDGHEALEACRRRDYDLVLSDVRMPGLDGPRLFEELARTGHPAVERWIFLTADTLSEATREFLARARVPHLSKPFTIDELRRVVRQVVAPNAP